MSRLNAQSRRSLPEKDFVFPGKSPGRGSFPIPDASHARAALSMAHFASNPAAVRAKVHAKFPNIGQKRDDSTHDELMRRLKS